MRIDVSAISVSDIPSGLRSSYGRLLWMRDSKMQMTPLGAANTNATTTDPSSSSSSSRWAPASNSAKLSLIATFDKSGDSGYKRKEYDFKVQVKEDRKGGRYVTVGKCTVDLARYGEGVREVQIGVPVKREFLGEGDREELGLGFDLRIVPVKGLDFDEDDEDDEDESDEDEGVGAEQMDGVVASGHTGVAAMAGTRGDVEEEQDGADAVPAVVTTATTERDGTSPKAADEEVVNVIGGNDDTDATATANDNITDENDKREGSLPLQRQKSTSSSLQKSSSLPVDPLVLQSLVAAAEEETREVRRMLEESIDMLEDETAARQEAEEAVQSLEREIDWLEKKAVKDRADWENRMKESLHKMESTVVLLETLQREKEEMEARMETSNAEVARLSQLADASFVEQKIKTAEEDAKRQADEQAAIETAALKKQIKTMAARLEMAEAKGGVGGAGGDVALGSKLAEELEESNKQLSIENQYLKIEIESLRQDASSAKGAAARVEQSARREAEVYAQRATDYAMQLKESQSACAEAERGAAEARSRIILLEDAVERGNLVAAELRQRVALNEMRKTAGVEAETRDAGKDGNDGNDGEEGPSPSTSPREARRREMEDVMRLMRDAQDSAEARASQLAAVTQELQAVSEELATTKQRAIDAQREADDACRLAMTMEEEAKSLRMELKARDDHRKEFDVDELRQGLQGGATQAATDRIDAERSTQAHLLAQEASQMAAALTEKLAYSNKDKADLRARLDESRQELHTARSENDVELRKRVDVLQRELVVSQNRAEVNAIFKEEHDRLAMELIEAKIGLAEASEELIVVKRSLTRSEEKGISFASKLTKLETRFYSVGGRRRRKKKDKDRADSASSEVVSPR